MQNINSVCFVGTISEINPIEGADKIEQAVISGWNCVVPKGLYKPGKLVIVATTDAVIPKELSDKLEITNYLRKGQRVRTVKLKGVYSECLIMDMIHANKICKEGDDLMDTMGVYKYEPPVKMVQLSSGRKIRYQDNPNFHIYYKFPNIKNVPDMFREDDEVEITRKIHGTNARYGIVKKGRLSLWDKVRKFFGHKWVSYEFVVGSHNVEKGSDSQGYYENNVWYDIEKKYSIKKKMWDHVKDFASDDPEHIIGSGFIIYGEIYGPGIQKGYDYGMNDIEFIMFDVSLGGEYLGHGMPLAIAEALLEIPHAEVLYFGKWSKETQDSFVFNNYIEGTKVPHEGIVVKDVSGDRRKIAKVINPDYLLWDEKNKLDESIIYSH